MAKTYQEALVALKNAVKTVQQCQTGHSLQEIVLLEDAVGRIAATDCYSPVSTPEFDTSAMDGFSVSSDATKHASPESPVVFQVRGTIAAGDDPSLPLSDPTQEVDVPIQPCVKIMTGARFPTSTIGRMLDACVKMEDTTPITSNAQYESIAVTKPVLRNANRRFAGEDIQKSDRILHIGQTIQSSHLMPLASVGLESIPIRTKPRVCVWSTGNELKSHVSRIPDVNGIYLTAASRELGAEANFMGTLDDVVESMSRSIGKVVQTCHVDVMITSGGVSVGQFDCVRKALELLDAKVIFHGLSIRPGHPVLFALLPSPRGKVAFFGLPGNPGAAAACFRFLTVPYLRDFLGQEAEKPVLARSQKREMEHNDMVGCRHISKGHLDVFRPGFLHVSSSGENVVSEMAKQIGPSKLSPFIRANCWIHLAGSLQAGQGEIVRCYPTTGLV